MPDPRPDPPADAVVPDAGGSAGAGPGAGTGPEAAPLRRRRGRPLLPAASLRSAALPPVRVTADELGQVEAGAADHGLTVSSFIRRIVLSRRLPPPVPRVNLEVWAKLAPLAGNLNQYMKAINQGRAAGAPLPLLLAIRQLLDDLRADLRGRTDGHDSDDSERL